MKNKLTTLWVNTAGMNHIFASNTPGILSLCGDKQHPKTAAEHTKAAYCYACAHQLRTILNYGRASIAT